MNGKLAKGIIMSLYSNWNTTTESFSNDQLRDAFWNAYIENEKVTYQNILSTKREVLSGKYSDLAEEFDWEPEHFIGFLDGINTSLIEELDLDAVKEDTELNIQIDWKKLYQNMLDYKAQWLYTLEEWNNIFDEKQRKEIKKEYNRSKTVVKGEKIGRNDPCPCGSGKKYKKCCLNK